MNSKRNLVNVLMKTVLFVLAAACLWSASWKIDSLCMTPVFFAIFLVYVATFQNWCEHKKLFLFIVLIAVGVIGVRMEVIANRQFGSLVAVSRTDPDDVRYVQEGTSFLSIRDYSFESYEDQVSVEDSVREGFPMLMVNGNIDIVRMIELRKKYGSIEAYKESLAVEIEQIIDSVATANPISQERRETRWLYLYLVQKEIGDHRFPFIYGRMWVNQM